MPPMIYPDAYLWLVFFSTLDILLTRLILSIGGAEVNPIANEVIHTWGWMGAALFKYALVTFAIIVCETVGRRTFEAGRRLSWTMVAIAAFPVIWSMLLLLGNPDAVASLADGTNPVH